MFRLLVASAMIGSCCTATAADSASPTKVAPCIVPPNVAPHVVADDTALLPNAVHYTAKIKFVEVRQKLTTEMRTEVAGVVGTPLKTDFSGKGFGRRLMLQLQDIPGGKPTKYVAQFQWVETQKDGKESVLFAPKVMTTAGVPAVVKVGDEKGDRFQLDLTVTEGTPAANKPKPATSTLTSSIRPAPSASSNLGTSLMHMVDPRIIITGEEEERLGVVPVP